MDPELLRQTTLQDIDAVLSAPWIVQRWLSADAKRLLRAQRDFWRDADAVTLQKLTTLYEQEPA